MTLAQELHVIWQVALADFRERTRRYPFLVSFLFCAWLSATIYAAKTQVTLGENYGYFNSAWSSVVVAVVANMVLSLVGFFLVKNTIERDEQTRVGPLLAATSLDSRDYLLGKCISNFLLLMSLGLVFMASIPFLQWHRGPQYPFEPLKIVTQFLLMVAPVAAFVGALAVLWEAVPLLKRGLGNVLYIIVWMTLLLSVGLTERSPADLMGFVLFMRSAQAAEVAQGIQTTNRFELNVGHMESDHIGRFLWNGIPWNVSNILWRAEWLLVAGAVCLLALFWFKRFDPDYAKSAAAGAWKSMTSRFRRKPRQLQPAKESKWTVGALPQTLLDRSAQAQNYFEGFQFVTVLLAELRLMLRSVPKSAYVLIALVNFIAIVAPSSEKMTLLPFLWLAPVLLWSQMGTRERREGTAALMFSAPHSFLRQLPALWSAGALVALLSAAGMIFRAVRLGDPHLLAACLAGAVFIPSLALACGVWSNTPRLFEALYVGLWYLALNGAPFADFMGLTPHSSPATFAVLGGCLFAAAMLRRWWDVERGPAQRVLAFAIRT
jgi:hypothetical protein